MTRTLILLVLFLLLGGATYWYMQNGSKSSSLAPTENSDRDFAIKNKDDIYKIFLAKRSGATTLLERKGDEWIFNGKHKARPNAIHMMLNTFLGQRVKYLAPKAAHKNMRDDLATNGIKVELYNKANEKIKCFYVGGVNNDETGTHMIMEGSSIPHIVHLPNWEGGLRVRYGMTGEDWRDKTVIGGKLEDIKSLSVEYPKQKDNSFKIEKNGKDYIVKPFYDDIPGTTRPYRKGSAEAYLVNFEKGFAAEAFENKNPSRDSVLNTAPFCIVRMTDIKGDENVVHIFPKYWNLDDVNIEKVSEQQTKIERFYAGRNNDDFLLIQTRVFKPIFRSYKHFFQQ